MSDWRVERIVHFQSPDFCKEGLAHFGFHDKKGRYYAIAHQKHFLGRVNLNGTLDWTVSKGTVFENVPNITAELSFPMYVDSLPDDTILVSNFGNNLLYRIDPARMRADLILDGSKLGMKDMGNCVVDAEGLIWVNEVTGNRIWRFDVKGQVLALLGNGEPGFQKGTIKFASARFSWIYDVRRGPDGKIYVLDSKNFAVRRIDPEECYVETVAGKGTPGYEGDGGNASSATFGGSPDAKFDGPISLSLDGEGDIFVGDRFNHVVRMIRRDDGTISTIAGSVELQSETPNNPSETNPRNVHLPKISSMDYHENRLLVPTDLAEDSGDLLVMARR